MTDKEKWNRGLDIFIESVLEPDSDLRAFAHEEECYHELMWVRENVLEWSVEKTVNLELFFG